MRGLPKHLNSKEDYEYIMANYTEAEWKPILQQLYDDRIQAFNRGVITGEGVTDDTHYVVEEKDMMSEDIIKYQYELAVNPDAHMFRIGYTEAELEAILGA